MRRAARRRLDRLRLLRARVGGSVKGEQTFKLTLDTSALTEALVRAQALLAKAQVPDEPISKALLGAAAAAVLLPKPVSRRRLLFPWMRA